MKLESNAPTVLVIFGVTGDLSEKKLFPAIFELHNKKILPDKYHIVGFSRRELDTNAFRAFVKEAILKKKFNGSTPSEAVLTDFLDHITYEQGLFDVKGAYHNLSVTLQKIDDGFRQCSNKLFYLAVPPHLYDGILGHLASSGLTVPCGGELGWTRVLIEKPFGKDIDSARALDHRLSLLFDEKQIFRIDHYLAKETIQNILTFRFSNSLFEDLWSAEHIESMHIRLFETNTVGNRGAFYEGVGALRDVGQNHALQMLALVTMENPITFESETVRKERAKIFSNLVAITKDTIASHAVRGQYENYLSEPNVKPDSTTETYFKLKTFIQNERWAGVPFILESGKAMSESKTEIIVKFKKCLTCLCDNGDKSHVHQNQITFHIQPKEGITIEFFAKKPGFTLSVEPKDLSFFFRQSDEDKMLPDAYEKVLYDCIRGDQVLFTSTQEVDLTWKYITPIIENWEKIPLLSYPRGTNGPSQPSL